MLERTTNCRKVGVSYVASILPLKAVFNTQVYRTCCSATQKGNNEADSSSTTARCVFFESLNLMKKHQNKINKVFCELKSKIFVSDMRRVQACWKVFVRFRLQQSSRLETILITTVWSSLGSSCRPSHSGLHGLWSTAQLAGEFIEATFNEGHSAGPALH